MKNVFIFYLYLMTVPLFAQNSTFSDNVQISVLNYADVTGKGYEKEKAIWDYVRSKLSQNVEFSMVELLGNDFKNRSAEYVKSGKMPDITCAWPSGSSTELHKKHMLKDLTPLLGLDYLKSFCPIAVDPKAQAGGYLAELPVGITATHVLYANKALLESNGLKIATTYEELKSQVPILKAKGIRTVLMANRDDWVMQSCLFSAIAARIAGTDFFDSILAGKSKFTDQPFISSLTFIKTLYDDGVLSKETLRTGYGDVPFDFAYGKGAYLVDGDWRTGAFLTNPDNGTALIPVSQQKNFVQTVFPGIPGQLNDAPETSIIVGTGYGISNAVAKGSLKEKLAIEVIKLLQSPEVQLMRLENGSAFPSRVDVTSNKLEPLAKSRTLFYTTLTRGGYVLDGVFDPQVIEPLNIGLKELGLGHASPQAVAERVQAAFVDWKKASKN